MNVTREPLIREKPGLLALRRINWSWQQLGLAGAMLLSAILNLYGLDPDYYTNEYYAAAVRSMLSNWHNFFYNAYDPGGFITIDKPPVAFWFQTISAWLFGYNGVSLLLPSALAGVISVALVYDLVKRSAGPVAGLVAAFALAVTPISVIMNRHNNPESLLILALVSAAWALSRSIEKGRLVWLLTAVALVGVGFNIKMLEAFIVLPAFYLVYLLLAPVKWWKRLVHLTLATVVLAVVSFSWALAVDLTPANQRPYIGGSANNSVFNLIFDYNGLGRIDGNEMGGPGGQRPNGQPGTAGQPPAGIPGFGGNNQTGGNTNNSSANGNTGRTGGFNNGNTGRAGRNGGFNNGTGGIPGGNFGGNNGAANANGGIPGGNAGFPGGPGGGGRGGNPVVAGQAGPLRMFDPQLAGEAGWLLPVALLGLVIAGVQSWRRFPRGKERTQRQQALLLWGGWLLTFMAVFSEAKGIFHSYYLVMLAPAIAALVGLAVESLWYAYRQGGWRSWLLPAVLLITAAFQLNILSAHADWNRTLALVMVVVELVAACALLAVPRLFQLSGYKWAIGVTGVALLGLMLAPIAWAINAILNATYTNATLPTAVPAGATGGGFGGFGFNNRVAANWLTKLQTNWNSWLSGLVFGLVMLALMLVALRFIGRKLQGRNPLERFMTLATVVVVIILGISLALTILPTPTASASSSNAAPSTGVIGNPSMMLKDDSKLIGFLEANRNGSTYLLATTSSQNASPLIIKTGQPVMALGGFMGSDKTVTSEELAQMVANNTVRYFLLDGFGGFGGARGGSQSALGWVQQNCKVVDSQLWSSSSSSNTSGNNFGGPGRGFGGSQGQLYDCRPQS
jgi:4-amino-4-deoxy-L-arabinose transferase-like glycosyltransferase